MNDISIYDPACYLPVYKLLQLAAVGFPQYADSFDIYNLISMAIYDDKDRIEFQCVYDSKINEALELWAAPVKVRCGHEDAFQRSPSKTNLLPSRSRPPVQQTAYSPRQQGHPAAVVPSHT